MAVLAIFTARYCRKRDATHEIAGDKQATVMRSLLGSFLCSRPLFAETDEYKDIEVVEEERQVSLTDECKRCAGMWIRAEGGLCREG